jgi:hypothetical protein
MQVLKGYYGAAKPVALLRGSTAKDMQPWMIEVSDSCSACVPAPVVRDLQHTHTHQTCNQLAWLLALPCACGGRIHHV